MKPKAAKEQRQLAADSLRQARRYIKQGVFLNSLISYKAYELHKETATALGWTRFNVPIKG